MNPEKTFLQAKDSKNPIPLARPCLGEPEVQAASRPILSGWVTQGPEVQAFEREFASYVGASYACAVSSCTAALHLALLAIEVKPGDEVLTVSHSFIATANVVRYCGAVPVFVDIETGTYNIDPVAMERAITPRTRVILCVHQMGMPCDLKQVIEIARKHNLFVIEDAACAVGSEIYWNGCWEKVGKPHGDIACFSFHPRKIMTTGDGGMITTAHSEWDQKFRLWRQHGMSVSDQKRHAARQVVFESYGELGYNYRMTDIQGAVGREQLKRLPEIVERRRFLGERYKKKLMKASGLRLPEEPSWAKSNWQSFCVGLPEGANQAKVMQYMLDYGIATRRGIMCSHREEAYSNQPWSCGVGPGSCGCPPLTCRVLKQSEFSQDHGILLPLYSDMTDSEQDRVAETLYDALNRVIR